VPRQLFGLVGASPVEFMQFVPFLKGLFHNL
jgi:hypothetical protein